MSEEYVHPASRPASDPAETLPPANLRRWMATHKIQVVQAVRAGVITLEEACKRYALSMEEFIQWQGLADRRRTSSRPVSVHPGLHRHG